MACYLVIALIVGGLTMAILAGGDTDPHWSNAMVNGFAAGAAGAFWPITLIVVALALIYKLFQKI